MHTYATVSTQRRRLSAVEATGIDGVLDDCIAYDRSSESSVEVGGVCQVNVIASELILIPGARVSGAVQRQQFGFEQTHLSCTHVACTKDPSCASNDTRSLTNCRKELQKRSVKRPWTSETMAHVQEAHQSGVCGY